ncbi:hypothetical protein Hdeb2414_s0018g00522451 [Helianthus debilis subsp. tardiflorus]
MSTLDLIKSDDTSDVVLKDAEAIEEEDVVARTAECRLVAGGKCINVTNVKGFTKAGSSKPSTCRSSRRLLNGTNLSFNSEPVDLNDDIEVSDDQEVEVEGKLKKGKELPLVVAKKGKFEGKRVVVSTAKGSPGKSGEGSVDVNAGDVYVPNWSVNVGDSFKYSTVLEDVLTHFAPPMVRGSLTVMDDDLMISRMMLSPCNFASLLPEEVSRFRKRMQEYEEFLKKREIR